MNKKPLEHLRSKEIEIFFDEFKKGIWFELGLYDIFNKTEVIERKKGIYYCFYAKIGENNPFRLTPKEYIKIYISKASFDREIVRHINFKSLEDDKYDLAMDICRIDRYNINIKNIVRLKHNNIGDDILQYVIRRD